MGHFVVGASELEREDRLEVFTFEEDPAFEAVREVGGVGEGSFFDDFVDAGGEDEAEVVGVAIWK